MPDNESASLAAGARMAIEVCMGVQPADRVWVISDVHTRALGELLCEAAHAVGAETQMVLLEDFGPRPVLSTPRGFMQAARAFQPTVTLYAAEGRPGEVAFRMQIRQTLLDLGVRHAHMPGLDARCVREGLSADYRRVAAVTQRVYACVKDARRIEVSNPDGTRLLVTCAPERLHWTPFDGLYHEPRRWGNLPEGETFTAPDGVEGVIVSYVLGDYFSAKYGLLRTPVSVPIARGRAQAVQCADEALRAELWNYLNEDPNGTRVGEFAIGTNVFLQALSGNLLQDEKIPGVHLAFGNPYPAVTGADWSARTHVDLVAPFADITVDGTVIMERGRFIDRLLG